MKKWKKIKWKFYRRAKVLKCPECGNFRNQMAKGREESIFWTQFKAICSKCGNTWKGKEHVDY